MENLSGIVYSISYKDLCYVGSSRMKGNERWVCHYNSYKYNTKTTTSRIVFEQADLDGVLPTYIILEKYAEISDENLRRREQSYIDDFDCVNENRAFVTEEDRNEDRKEHQKKYRKNNKEQIKEQEKEWNKNNREYINDRQKIYNELHKEKLKEQRRKRYAEKKIKANTIDAEAT